MENKAIIQKQEITHDSRYVIDLSIKQKELNQLEMIKAVIRANLDDKSFKNAIVNIMGVKE